MLPKVSVKNIIVVLTNVKDESECHVDVSELTSFLGEAISQNNVFYVDNPYCKLEKLQSMKSKQGMRLEEIAIGLKQAFTETSETLRAILTSVMSSSSLQTSDFMRLFQMKESIERTTWNLMAACENVSLVQKAIQQMKQDIDEAVRTKTLNQSFVNTYTIPKLVIVYTDDYNTLCGVEGCNSNCHLSCALPKQGDHKVKMCDKDIIKLCHCMDEVTNICNVCGHSYEYHCNIKHRFEKKKEQVTHFDEAMKEKYEKAEENILNLSAKMKENLDFELVKVEQEVGELSETLMKGVSHFESLAGAASYAKVIECQLIVVEQRMKAAPSERTNSSTMCELAKTKEHLEKKLKLLTDAGKAQPVSTDSEADLLSEANSDIFSSLESHTITYNT